MCPQTLCGPRTVGRGCDDDDMPAPDRDPRSAPGDAEPVARVATRALVVEDEVEMAQVIGSYLEREGFEVHLSHDGVDAVARAREVDPDIVDTLEPDTFWQGFFMIGLVLAEAYAVLSLLLAYAGTKLVLL